VKLINRDVFAWRNSRWRLIKADPHGKSWIIDIQDPNAWPISIPSSELAGCERETSPEPLAILQPKSTHLAKAACDYALLQELLAAGDALLDPLTRPTCIVIVARRNGRSPKTIRKLLRRFWQRGMTQAALLPDFRNCGRRGGGMTSGRGRRPCADRQIYQITEDDIRCFEAAINYYYQDPRRPLQSAFNWLIQTFYTIYDGNGRRYALHEGERPTRRQFEYYFRKHHPLDKRIKKRHGDKEFSRGHRPTLSDTIADCLGVAQRYEIDATIADVDIVMECDRKTIIGKVTVYFIVDRKSRLIVGFYVGLENPCWETAVEAIISLTESKREICERYGVEYDPNDWPADGLLPREFLGDHGEMISKWSSQLANLGISVANPPALLPNFKPNVETRFKLLSTDLRDIAPGYDPPENLGKRRRKSYEKEACLTLREITAEILEAIIKYNRRPLQDYPRSPDQIVRRVEPSPIALWNDFMSQDHCHGSRFRNVEVQTALLPRDTATITHKGLLFKDLYYTSDDPELNRAFVRARDGREKVTVSYDRRAVDYIYMHMPNRADPLPVALSNRNHGYRGLSFREVQLIKSMQKDQKRDHEQTRLQVDIDRHERSAHRIRAAEQQRDALGALSVAARTANTVAARAAEKRQERIARSDRQAERAGFSSQPDSPAASVTGLPVQNRLKQPEHAPLTEAQLARRRMG
jgi:hypothetical protein